MLSFSRNRVEMLRLDQRHRLKDSAKNDMNELWLATSPQYVSIDSIISANSDNCKKAGTSLRNEHEREACTNIKTTG